MVKFAPSFGSTGLSVGCRAFSSPDPSYVFDPASGNIVAVSTLDDAQYAVCAIDCPEISDSQGPTGRYLYTLPIELEPQTMNLEFYIAPFVRNGIARAVANYIPGSEGDLTPEQIWSYVPRTLTYPIVPPVDGLVQMDIGFRRGDTMSLSFQGLGALDAASNIWFTVKETQEMTDARANLQIQWEGNGGTTGINYLNGIAKPDFFAEIDVVDAGAGNINITLDARATERMTAGVQCYDIQVKSGVNVATLAYGYANIDADVTRNT